MTVVGFAGLVDHWSGDLQGNKTSSVATRIKETLNVPQTWKCSIPRPIKPYHQHDAVHYGRQRLSP